jgi:hypothetical protein
MAKGKKASGKTYTSAGLHSNVRRSVLTAVRADRIARGDRVINQQKAFRAGKRVMVTIKNPENDPSRLFIRVSADTIWKNRTGEGFVIGGA